MATIKILGTNSDHDTCSRCGKTNLKKVVWIEIDDGEPEPIGCECAARLMKKSGNAVWNDAKHADSVAEKAAKREVHNIGESRSIINWYVVRVYSDGLAVVLCRANGDRKAVVEWAENKFQSRQIEATNENNMRFYSRVEW